MSQNEAILAALCRGEVLTALTALQLCGTLRLSERVRELERDGVPIAHNPVRVGEKRVMSYRLAV